MLNGVTASKVFLADTTSNIETIYQYLCCHFPHIQPNEWKQRFNDQLIFNLNGEILNLNSSFQANTHIYYYRFLENEVHVPFYEQIIFENDDLLVVDKPHFLTISPTGQYVQETLLVRLKKITNNPDLTPIHRLDRETAGIVLFSKKPQSRGMYQQLFAEKKVQKIYHAIAPYCPHLSFPHTVELRMEKGEPFYTMQVVGGSSNSRTEINLIDHNQNWAKYLLKPITGKQHQLRVHLNSLNIPIKNDPFYPIVIHKVDTDFSAPLQLLAKEIFFTDPITQQEMHFCSNKELTL